MRCVIQTDWEKAFVCLTVCVPKRQASLMGFSWEPPTVNSLICIHFHLQWARWTQSPPGWHVSVCQPWPERSALFLISSVYYISLYQSLHVSQDHRGSGNQTWTRQNTRPLQTKPQGVNECVCERERDSTILKCWHLLQALAGLECDTLLYTKGLGPCSRHKETSICPSPRGQHTYEMTVSMPHAFFSQPLTLIKTTKPSFIPWYCERWLICTLFEEVVSELC